MYLRNSILRLSRVAAISRRAATDLTASAQPQSSAVPETLFSNPALRPNSVFQRLSSSESSSTSQLPNIESEISPEEQEKVKEVISLVDEQIGGRSHGRLFACVYFDGVQRKFTEGDLIMLNSDLGIDIGTRITIDKVTLVGSRDFTLMGRPVLPRDLARVEATVVEKNLSKTEIYFDSKRKKDGKPLKKVSQTKYKFSRNPQTTLRINRIDLLCPLEEAKDRVGFEMRDDSPVFK